MKKKLLFLIVATFALTLQATQVIDLRTSTMSISDSISEPECTIDYTETGISVCLKICEIGIIEDNIFSGTYHINIPGCEEGNESGLPALPSKIMQFILPQNSNPTISVISSKYTDLNYEIAPGRKAMMLKEAAPYSKFNIDPIKTYSGFWPKNAHNGLDIQIYRQQPIAEIKINPIIYNHLTKTVRAYTEIELRINFDENSDIGEIYLEPGSMLNPNSTLNPYFQTINSYSFHPEIGSSKKVSNGYIILSVPEFKETLYEFVKWKKKLGYNVIELYDDKWTPKKIKSAIKTKYQEDPSILYLLIVGNHKKVCADTVSIPNFNDPIYERVLISDYLYGCLDGENDIQPELYRGRWPVDNTYDLQRIIDKTIWYEQSPSKDESFYKHGTNFSYFEDGRTNHPHDGEEDGIFVRTCEDVRDYLQNHYDFTIDRLYSLTSSGLQYWPSAWNSWYTQFAPFSDELKYPNYKWDATPDSVINAVNKGSLFLMFTGHGWNNAWEYGNSQTFTRNDIVKMNNCNLLPLIISMTCLSGNHSKSPCLMESFLTKNNGGTFATFSSTNYGYTGWDQKFATLLISAIWHEPGLNLTGSLGKSEGYDNSFYFNASNLKLDGPFRQLGATLDFAQKGFSYTNNEKLKLYYRYAYHLYGDPSIYFKAEYPSTLDGIEINRGNQGVNVYIYDNDAYIAFYDPISDKSALFFGNEASYFTNEAGGARYVDVAVYTAKSVPYIESGEPYFGYIGDTSQLSGIIGYHDTRNGSVEIEYILSPEFKNKYVEMHIVDSASGNIVSSWPVDKSITGQKTTLSMRTNSGVMIAYLMVGGAPVSNMKMYISK